MADRKISALTELAAPVADDQFTVVDVSEADNADKNKRITYGTMFRALPNGTAGAPTIAFASDNGNGGIYRSAANEIAISANSAEIGKFTTAGLQLGGGTATAQLHLFSTDTTDQVIIENTDAGLDTAPDLVLYRNSASPAADDNLGNIEFRGESSTGDTHAYAQITAGIQTATDGSEDGILDLMSSSSGTTASRLRLRNQFVGINENEPAFPLHVTNTVTGNALNIECSADDPASGADITLFHRRGAADAGQDDDVLSTLFFRGKNDNDTPEEIDYAAVEASIVSASDTTEDGRLRLQVQTAGTLTTQLEINANTIGFFGTTPATQPAAIANMTTTATTGTLPTTDETITIADAASPTNAELLEYCVELQSKLEAALAALRSLGVIAT